jgi:Ca2+-binding RTX toxin-like protein
MSSDDTERKAATDDSGSEDGLRRVVYPGDDAPEEKEWDGDDSYEDGWDGDGDNDHYDKDDGGDYDYDYDKDDDKEDGHDDDSAESEDHPAPSPALDGIVEGSDDADVIDAHYDGDPEGDRIDAGDAIDPAAGPEDDSVLGFAGDDTIYAGAGDDTVEGGAGDDCIEGGAGDDVLKGDGAAAPGPIHITVKASDAGFENGLFVYEIDPETGEPFNRFDLTDNVKEKIDYTFTYTPSSAGATVGVGIESPEGTFYSSAYGDNLDLNPDGKLHTALLSDEGDTPVRLGFEDLKGLEGYGEEPDFDDVVVEIDLGTSGATLDNAHTDYSVPLPETGHPGDDTLFGGHGDDALHGQGGNDKLVGGEGHDTLSGGAGHDTLKGGDGADSLDGGDGNDLLKGQDGDDTLSGGAGHDRLFGGQGDDSLDGGDGDDKLVGWSGEDTLTGGDGHDTLKGGHGRDELTGGEGADTIKGGADQDTILGATPDDEIHGGAGGYDFDKLDLRGSGRFRLIKEEKDSDGNGYDGRVEFLDNEDHVTGTTTYTNIEEFHICFTPGSLIATPQGARLVEELAPGDRVITRDNGIQELAWTGSKTLTPHALARAPHLRPILIRAGALGNGLPEQDLMVSPNHRVLIGNAHMPLYFDESEVLVAAKHLTGLPGIDQVTRLGATYVHIMCERHEVVLSNGAWTESFQPGDYSLQGIGEAQRSEILELFPELATEGTVGSGFEAARRVLKKHEARLIAL